MEGMEDTKINKGMRATEKEGWTHENKENEGGARKLFTFRDSADPGRRRYPMRAKESQKGGERIGRVEGSQQEPRKRKRQTQKGPKGAEREPKGNRKGTERETEVRQKGIQLGSQKGSEKESQREPDGAKRHNESPKKSPCAKLPFEWQKMIVMV